MFITALKHRVQHGPQICGIAVVMLRELCTGLLLNKAQKGDVAIKRQCGCSWPSVDRKVTAVVPLWWVMHQFPEHRKKTNAPTQATQTTTTTKKTSGIQFVPLHHSSTNITSTLKHEATLVRTLACMHKSKKKIYIYMPQTLSCALMP